MFFSVCATKGFYIEVRVAVGYHYRSRAFGISFQYIWTLILTVFVCKKCVMFYRSVMILHSIDLFCLNAQKYQCVVIRGGDLLPISLWYQCDSCFMNAGECQGTLYRSKQIAN